MAHSLPLTREDVAQSTRAVDLRSYTGVWYAVATLRATGFQQGCRQMTRVEYQIRSEGDGLVVRNACEAFFFGNVVQEISAVPKSANNRILLVGAYGGRRDGNYVVYEFADEIVPAHNHLEEPVWSTSGYRWVIVGDSDLGEAWLMVRDPREGTAIMRETAPLLRRIGIYDQLLLEPQPDADYMIDGSVRRTRSARVSDYLAGQSRANSQ
ncbi:MAG: lipocalin family protein [Spirochaetota bacterium]